MEPEHTRGLDLLPGYLCRKTPRRGNLSWCCEELKKGDGLRPVSMITNSCFWSLDKAFPEDHEWNYGNYGSLVE